MQLSALQKLEVVSHADCRACLFTSKHSNDWWSVLPETSFKDAPGYDLLTQCIVPQCGIAFLIGGSMIMWQWATKIHLDRELIICESWLRWFNEKEFPLESNLLIVGTAHRTLFWAEKNLWGCRNIKESRLNRSGQRHMPQDHFRTQCAFKWALKHQFANEHGEHQQAARNKPKWLK